jgi:hypothetical protein
LDDSINLNIQQQIDQQSHIQVAQKLYNQDNWIFAADAVWLGW